MMGFIGWLFLVMFVLFVTMAVTVTVTIVTIVTSAMTAMTAVMHAMTAPESHDQVLQEPLFAFLAYRLGVRTRQVFLEAHGELSVTLT